jgi:hypothetical protein
MAGTQTDTASSLVAFSCDVLLEGRTEWIRRRKETREILTETAVRHRMSLDFEVDGLPRTGDGERLACLVPLALLPKQPRRFTCFDLVDEAGRSLPLPTLVDNAALSAEILVEAARRVLAPEHPSPELLAELRLIARSETDLALALVRRAYLDPQGAVATDDDAPDRGRLIANPDFRWLLRTLAYSSVVAVELPLDERPRRIVKLAYDEHVADVTDVRKKTIVAKLGAWGYRLGWRGYVAEYMTPFAGARSYHVEVHAPPGMQLLDAGMNDQPATVEDRRCVHLYRGDARRERTVISYVQFRVRGPGFVGAASQVSFLIFCSLAVAWHEAERLVDTSTSTPALLLLFPGLIAGYLARPAHALVARLLNLARWALAGSALVAYLAAGRLALVSTAHPASEDDLELWLGASTVVAGVLSAVLIASWCLPMRLSSRARTAWRAWRQRRARKQAA